MGNIFAIITVLEDGGALRANFLNRTADNADAVKSWDRDACSDKNINKTSTFSGVIHSWFKVLSASDLTLLSADANPWIKPSNVLLTSGERADIDIMIVIYDLVLSS